MSGSVYWITGLSGSGKSRTAKALVDQLRARHEPVLFLDGDEVREAMGDALGYDREARLVNAHRMARLCRLASDQGLTVVCATVSLFHEVHDWNRANLERYCEVLLDVPLPDLISGDAKGHYARARSRLGAEVVGVDIQPEFPRRPDLILKNDRSRPPEALAALILQRGDGHVPHDGDR